MHESSTRNVLAIRAIELEDRDCVLWSDADRAWASEAGARDVGEGAAPDAFLAARAARAFERLGPAGAGVRRAIAAFTWRRWIAPLVLAIAFVLGVGAEQLDSSNRINVLAPPVLGVLLWNIAVYAVLLLRPLVRRGAARFVGPMRRIVLSLAGGRMPWLRPRRNATLAAAVSTFATDWVRVASPLYVARAARVLHGAAAVFAAGVIAGLYLRGIAVEFRASWESTFLTAHDVQRLLSFALAPGTWLTGWTVPGVDEIARIRAPGGSENAARWLHHFAATLAVVVIVPRLLLAIWNGWLEERRARRLRVDLEEPYFRRLLRAYREAPMTMAVVPYSYTLPAERERTLRTIIERAYSARTRIVVQPPIGYGGEDAPAVAAVPGDDTDVVLALFNAAATPERATHGAFVAQMAHARRGPAIALVDESSMRERWAADAARRDARRHAWRDALGAARVVFIDLDAADKSPFASALVEAIDTP